ncbi:hypothetical protein AB0E08_48475 [Streptomyces sp. NPDC048281]|uniref:hypothetical protein n=1 Tax=Streptomyces sp. NPDC048281 TaxID=3154715 RepID=UPI0034145C01
MAIRAEQTEKRLVYYRWRLGRSELDRLFSVAREGFADDEVVLSTVRNDTRYRQRSLEGLVSAILTSPTAGDPQTWGNIHFEAVKEGDGRHLEIHIDSGKLVAYVVGSDATWVYGQTARLDMLLRESKASPSEPGITSDDGWWFLPVGIVALSLVALGNTTGIMLGIFTLGNVLVGITLLKRMRQARLFVTQDLPPHGVRQHLREGATWEFAIAAVSAAAGVVSAFK